MKKLIVALCITCSFLFLPIPNAYAAPDCQDIGEACGLSGSGGKGGGGIATPCCNPSKNGKVVICGTNHKCAEEQQQVTCVSEVGKKCSKGAYQPDQCCKTDAGGKSLFCKGGGLSGTCEIVKDCVGTVGAKCSPLAGDDDPQCCNVETGTSNPLSCGPDSKCKTNIIKEKTEEPTLPPPPSPPCKAWNNGQCDTFGSGVGDLATKPTDFIRTLFALLLSFSGAIAALLVMKSGYSIMTSQGKPEKLKEAQEQLSAAIVGLTFLIFSFVILQVIGYDILHIPGFGGANGAGGGGIVLSNVGGPCGMASGTSCKAPFTCDESGDTSRECRRNGYCSGICKK